MVRGLPAWALLVLMLLLASASSPHAQIAGVNIGWNECGTAGSTNAEFACAADTGYNDLFGSFVAPVDISQLEAAESIVRIAFESGSMPPWWDFHAAGACRRLSLTMAFAHVLEDTSFCRDYWTPRGAAGGIAGYAPYLAFPGTMQLSLLAAVPQDQSAPLEAGREYLAFRLRIDHAHSSTCGGCNGGACVWFDQVELIQPSGIGDVTLNTGVRNQFVTWQATGFPHGCAIPVVNRTWGQIKSIWR